MKPLIPMKQAALLLFLNLIMTTLLAQIAPTKEWDVGFGGSGDDFCYSIQQTLDGGYILCGYSNSGISGDKTQSSQGGYDFWIIRTDANGIKQWDRTFGGNGDELMFLDGTHITITSDEGFIIGGYSNSGISGDKSKASNGGYDYWVIKTDSTGIKQWDASFGGSGDDFLNTIVQTTDGGYILSGSSTSGISGDKTQGTQGGQDFWIVKIDQNGAKQWDATFGGSSDDWGALVCQSSDGGYIVGGTTLSGISGNKTQPNKGAIDSWIVKLDINGTKEWEVDYGGSDNDYLVTLNTCADGGFIFAAVSRSHISGDKTQDTKGGFDYWVVKTDSNGVKSWDADFGASAKEEPHKIQQTADGGYIIGGYSGSGIEGDKTDPNQGGDDYWIVKTDSNGIKQWDEGFGGNTTDWLWSNPQTSDGGYILGGYSSSGVGGDKTQASQGGNDFWMIKLSCEVPQTFYADTDGDDFGNSNAEITDCIAPSGYVSNNTDCDDGDPDINPGVTEICNGIDDDCDGVIDADKWLSFDGINDRINCGDVDASENTSTLTLEAWVKFAVFSGSHLNSQSRPVISKWYNANNAGLNSFLLREQNGTIEIWVDNGTASGSFVFGWTHDLQIGQWYHIAATFDNGNLKLFRNGIEVAGTVSSIFTIGNSSTTLLLGDWFQSLNSSYKTFDGEIDEVRIWNVARTPVQLQSSMNTTLTGTESGLIVYYDFENAAVIPEGNNSGITTLQDRATAGGTNNGSLENFTLNGSTSNWLGVVSATEVCNGIDDDCDGTIDNGFDLDGDTYTTCNGDCDDNNASTNPNGLPSIQWDTRFGGTSNDRMSYTQQTSDGGYILAGLSRSPISGDKSQANWDATNATFDYWVVKTDAGGVKQWEKRYGGTANDSLIAVEQTPDGGYLLAGYSNSGIGGDKTQASVGLQDYWIVKTDATGVKQWDKTFGGTSNDQLQGVQLTADGGFILGGISSSGIGGDKSQASIGARDYWIVKTDAAGVKQWDKTFGGSSNDLLFGLRQSTDGGYILGGRSASGISGDKTQANWDGTNTTYDYWIVKTDGSGVKQWDKTFGGTGNDQLFAIRQATDGGYILGGYSNSGISGDKTQASQGINDYWVVKTDGSGNKLWDARYGGSDEDQMYVIWATAGGGYLFGGRSKSPVSGDKTQASQGNYDYWIVKTDDNGVKQWDRRYGGSQADVVTGLDQVTDGGYIIGGYSFSGISGDKTQGNWDATLATMDYWIVKLNSNTGYQIFYADADNDGYGTAASSVFACTGPNGYVTDKTDCNDANGAIHPNASDLCNSIDDNCNGVVDENAITATITPTGTVTVCSGTDVLLTASSGSGINYQWLKNAANISGATNITYTTNKKGDYQVMETNNFSCNSTSPITTIKTLSKPDAIITPLGDLDICVTGSVVLQANGGSGLTYQWMKGSNNIAGATNQTYTATQAKTYKVIVTKSNGCSKTSAGTKVTNSCKDATVMDQVIASQLSVYPNPTDGKFIIELVFAQNEEDGEVASIEVLNTLGQIIHSEKITVENGLMKKEIPLDHSPANGMYLVKVMVNDQIYSSQIVYQK